MVGCRGDVSIQSVEDDEAVVAHTLQVTITQQRYFRLLRSGERHVFIRALGTEDVSAATAMTRID